MKLFCLILVLVHINLVLVKSARILGIFPTASPSHYILGNNLMKGLANAGHDVTAITAYEDNEKPIKGSYRNIVLTGVVENFLKMIEQLNLYEGFGTKFESFMLQSVMLHVTERTFNNTHVEKLLNSKEQFDVVIVEQFHVDALKMFAHHFNAPLIAFSTIGPSVWVNGMMGNPTPLSYVPQVCTDLPNKMSITQRTLNMILYILEQLTRNFSYFPNHDAILKKFFPNPPSVSDLYYNVSLLLLNSHISLNQPVPLVPNMIEIGGFHVKPPKPLPKDLKDYLDNAKEGVVYFSMGSNLKSKNLPVIKRDAFLKAFGKLKHKVLWKWEDDKLPGKPPNVKISKWLPQQDILAHPNVKLFITHSGLLSTTEAVYNGVPILSIPVFGDQRLNANNAAESGYALSLPYNDPSFSEEKLSSLLHELLSNPKYKQNVQRRSRVFHDRPMKPMDSAVYWVEYVIRHRGAPHLRVAGIQIPWYQNLLLDVFAFVAVVIISVILLVCIIIKKFTKYKGAKLKEN